MNGSKCTENPYDEGNYSCDCDAAIFDSALAGLYCEHEATTYCTLNQEVSKTSFCTNKGECKAQVDAGSAHLGCDCKNGYLGPHCEFTKNSNVEEFLNGQQRPTDTGFGLPGTNANGQGGGGDGGLGAAVTAIIVLVVLGFVGGVGFFLYRKKQQQGPAQAPKLGAAPELALDPDGEVLQDSMRFGGGADSGDGPLEDVSIDNVDAKGQII